MIFSKVDDASRGGKPDETHHSRTFALFAGNKSARVALAAYPRTVGDWLILRSLRSKMCLFPSLRVKDVRARIAQEQKNARKNN
jgi:hypothetical protein